MSFYLCFFPQGADYVELDVHLSKDFQPVVFHDFHVAIRVNQVCLNPKKNEKFCISCRNIRNSGPLT